MKKILGLVLITLAACGTQTTERTPSPTRGNNSTADAGEDSIDSGATAAPDSGQTVADAGSTAVIDSGTTGPVDTGMQMPSAVDQIEQKVVGHYVSRLQLAQMIDVPFSGVKEQIVASFGTFSIRREGDRFVATQQGCRVTSTAEGITTTIPDDVPRNVAPIDSIMEFSLSGGNITWSRAEVVSLVGINLADPANDVMPTDSSDPRIFDHEQDGKPGATISVQSGIVGGDIYVIQRNKLRHYDGTMPDASTLFAYSDDNGEQIVIGASNPLLRTAPDVTKHADATKSNMQLKRVSTQYDCDQLINELGTLFP